MPRYAADDADGGRPRPRRHVRAGFGAGRPGGGQASAARAGISGDARARPPRSARRPPRRERPNVFARIGRFLREVVAELRKVIWPTRNQMVTYTIVVIVFVVVHGRAGRRPGRAVRQGVLAIFG